MGAAKLTRREARAIAKELIAEGRANPPTVRPGAMTGHWKVGDGMSAHLRVSRRARLR